MVDSGRCRHAMVLCVRDGADQMVGSSWVGKGNGKLKRKVIRFWRDEWVVSQLTKSGEIMGEIVGFRFWGNY